MFAQQPFSFQGVDGCRGGGGGRGCTGGDDRRRWTRCVCVSTCLYANIDAQVNIVDDTCTY